MNRKLTKYSLYSTLLLLSMFSACVSITKEGKRFVVQLKAISPAATSEYAPSDPALHDMNTGQPDSPAATPGIAPSTATLYDMSTGQPEPLNHPPSQFRNETNLRWERPTTNADGTPLYDLDSYKIYYGETEKSFDSKDRMRINVTKNTTSITIYNFSSSRWCFQVTANDSSRNESEFSNGVCRNIP